jgi:hypothetical protein
LVKAHCNTIAIRICIYAIYCNDLEIEDENHFLWQCEKYKKEREILFKKVSLYYKKISNFHNDTMKSKLLLNSKYTQYFIGTNPITIIGKGPL